MYRMLAADECCCSVLLLCPVPVPPPHSAAGHTPFILACMVPYQVWNVLLLNQVEEWLHMLLHAIEGLDWLIGFLHTPAQPSAASVMENAVDY